MKLKLKRSNTVCAMLLIYLAVMAYIGRGEFVAGHYLYYFGIIGVTLLCIALLFITLRSRERMRARRRAERRARRAREAAESVAAKK